MATMREKIAKAIDPIAWGRDGDYPAERSRIEARRATSLQQTDAVLSAMAEPTHAMIEAGFHAGNAEFLRIHGHPAGTGNLTDNDMVMMRAALAGAVLAAKEGK